MVHGHTLPSRVKKKKFFEVDISPPLENSPQPIRSSGIQPTTGLFANTLRSRYLSMISPRSSNYERLEGGHGPSRIKGSKRFGWTKFGIGAAILIFLVYFFGPRASPWKTKEVPATDYDDEIELHPMPPSTVSSDPPKTSPSPTENKHPESYESDPDPSKTTHCTSPHSSTKPLVQYALMIDAGSTGSRIHVYKFNNCGPSAEYEYEVFKMTQPGLGSLESPEMAARSLDVLLDEAVSKVPFSMHNCTPVAVKATAGLRSLPGSQSTLILRAVEKRIREGYPFQLPANDSVVIMDGKDEGVYAWITANYLLGTIKGDTPMDTPTHAVLDLGGASTQIVFEPNFAKTDQKLEDGEHKYELKFGERTHVLYQHSYLGYGLMKARKHVHSLVDFMASIRSPLPKEVAESIVGNPCLARGTRRVVEVVDENTQVKRNVTMDGEEIGSFEACDRIVQLVLAKDAICEMKPCSFNGVYQPSLLDAFPSGPVLLLSYFYDRIFPLITPSSPITVSTLASLATSVCLGRPKWLDMHWASEAKLMAELEGRPEWCLDLTFMHALLQLGYEFPDGRALNIGKQINETELSWTLGATIELVGGELKCRD